MIHSENLSPTWASTLSSDIDQTATSQSFIKLTSASCSPRSPVALSNAPPSRNAALSARVLAVACNGISRRSAELTLEVHELQAGPCSRHAWQRSTAQDMHASNKLCRRTEIGLECSCQLEDA